VDGFLKEGSSVKSSFVALVWLFAVLSWSTPARAGEPHTHDGFFLRLSGGVGYASTSEDFEAGELKVSGPSGDANLAIGGVVSPNLALHATLWAWALSDPDVEFENLSSELNGDVTLSGFGGGLTYYFAPSNVYLSGSVGAAVMEVDFDGGPEAESDTGLAVDFTIGKEWWVGNNWGLGLAGALGFHSVPDQGGDENLTGTSVGLRFSATLN
jgi:hypothetical protein